MVSSTTGKALVGALLAVAVLSAGGCKRGSTDLERWVVDVKSRPAPPLDPLPVMKQFETFEYAAQHLRGPTRTAARKCSRHSRSTVSTWSGRSASATTSSAW